MERKYSGQLFTRQMTYLLTQLTELTDQALVWQAVLFLAPPESCPGDALVKLHGEKRKALATVMTSALDAAADHAVLVCGHTKPENCMKAEAGAMALTL